MTEIPRVFEFGRSFSAVEMAAIGVDDATVREPFLHAQSRTVSDSTLYDFDLGFKCGVTAPFFHSLGHIEPGKEGEPMTAMLSQEMLSNAVEIVCYLSTIVAAVFSWMLAPRG